VRRALRAGAATGDVLPDVIRLLAWDVVARDAAAALRDVAPTAASRLVAALLDPDEEFAVRRRLPSVLARVPTQAVADGLAAGLADPRFEVRYRCGLALHRIRGQAPALRIDDATVIGAVLREVNVDRGVWESHRVLDRQEDEEWSPMFDEVLRDRASRALQHVFTMLALVLPREPLQLAFRGLHTRDPQVRGTALEYLEVTLPKNVRVALWPFLEDTRTVAPTPRSRDEVLRDLLASQATIALDLRRLRRGSADG
jgi:AAA family ATP:ADP antiporter